jgi:hypothetical protein
LFPGFPIPEDEAAVATLWRALMRGLAATQALQSRDNDEPADEARMKIDNYFSSFLINRSVFQRVLVVRRESQKPA